jgi:hypothetical protein
MKRNKNEDQVTITQPVPDGTDSVGGLSPGAGDDKDNNKFVVPKF